MAEMDSEQIIGSCNAAGTHFLQDRDRILWRFRMETWRGSILRRYSRPNGMAAMGSEQILGS
jgi:hypothetical protein